MKHLKEYTVSQYPSKVNYGGPIENSGILYKIMNLNTNLSQKGNDVKSPIYDKFIFNCGDLVSGVCAYDNKEHIGYICNITFAEEGTILYYYIIDANTRQNIALIPETVYFASDYDINHLYDQDEDELDENRKIKKRKMNKRLLEYYQDETDQLNNELKTFNRRQRKFDDTFDERKQHFKDIIGLITFNRLNNRGDFAPIYLNQLNLELIDFMKLDPDYSRNFDSENAERIIDRIGKDYYKNTFRVFDDGYSFKIKTDIVFTTLDSLIVFFEKIEEYYKRVCKKEKINWNAIVTKFRKYF